MRQKIHPGHERLIGKNLLARVVPIAVAIEIDKCIQEPLRRRIDAHPLSHARNRRRQKEHAVLVVAIEIRIVAVGQQARLPVRIPVDRRAEMKILLGSRAAPHCWQIASDTADPVRRPSPAAGRKGAPASAGVQESIEPSSLQSPSRSLAPFLAAIMSGQNRHVAARRLAVVIGIADRQQPALPPKAPFATAEKSVETRGAKTDA